MGDITNLKTARDRAQRTYGEGVEAKARLPFWGKTLKQFGMCTLAMHRAEAAVLMRGVRR